MQQKALKRLVRCGKVHGRENAADLFTNNLELPSIVEHLKRLSYRFTSGPADCSAKLDCLGRDLHPADGRGAKQFLGQGMHSSDRRKRNHNYIVLSNFGTLYALREEDFLRTTLVRDRVGR